MEEKNSIVVMAEEYIDKGLDAFSNNQLSDAAQLVQKAIQLLKQTNEIKLYARSLNLLGVIYAAIGNETMAIDCYLDGLEMAQEYKIYELMFLFYNNIGSRYQELGEHRKAIYYFERSRVELEKPDSKEDKSYQEWCIINYLNLVNSNCALGLFMEAEHYLSMVEKIIASREMKDDMYAYMISKCRMYWKQNKKEFVYEHLDELMDLAMENQDSTDFVQDMTEACDLLMNMEEYERWSKMIERFSEYAKMQDTAFFHLKATELWMHYYKTIGDFPKYGELCVEHAELMEKQNLVLTQEKVAAIDMKIELRAKEVERKRAERKSSQDPLTGLWNRYRLEQDAEKLFKAACEMNQSVTIGVLDIDCFKQQNDTYGHIQGDYCLKQMTDIIQKSIGDFGAAYRYGGDEFVILLSHGEKSVVEKVAVSLKDELLRREIPNVKSSVMEHLTVSQGYVCFQPKKLDQFSDFLKIADRELYQVKERGRNGYSIMVKNMP